MCSCVPGSLQSTSPFHLLIKMKWCWSDLCLTGGKWQRETMFLPICHEDAVMAGHGALLFYTRRKGGGGSEEGPEDLNHTTRFLPKTPPDLRATRPVRSCESPPPYFFTRPKKRPSIRERRDGPISSQSPKIDFRALLNGSEHIVLLCLCKAALNYSMCMCAGYVC